MITIIHADGSRVSIAFVRLFNSVILSVCLWVCLSVCPHDKIKTAETKITKLGTGISCPSMNIRSKLKGRAYIGLRLGLSVFSSIILKDSCSMNPMMLMILSVLKRFLLCPKCAKFPTPMTLPSSEPPAWPGQLYGHWSIFYVFFLNYVLQCPSLWSPDRRLLQQAKHSIASELLYDEQPHAVSV